MNRKQGKTASRRSLAGLASAALAATLILGGAAPAALAYDGNSGGYTSCGSNWVVTESSTTYSTYHKVNSITIGHWVHGASYVYRAVNTGAHAVADWEIYSLNGSMAYGYPVCRS